MAKKPTAVAHGECPGCKARIKIEVYKERVGRPAPPAEYNTRTVIELDRQAGLFPGAQDGDGKGGKADVTPADGAGKDKGPAGKGSGQSGKGKGRTGKKKARSGKGKARTGKRKAARKGKGQK